MTEPAETPVDRIPIAHSVRYAARGLPEVPNQYGPGVLAPSEITLTYRAAPDSQLGRVHAYVAGRIWVDGAELPLLPGGLYGQHYDDGLDGWPEWLAEEARLHDPDAPAVSAGVAPATAVVAAAPVKQRADCTELEWAEQERARFERLYTRETVRADLAEQRAGNAARDADIYQQRLERLGEGYTRERKRAEAAEAEAEQLRTDQGAEVCICRHTEQQHFEDACLVCDCGDYLIPEAAREVISRLQQAVNQRAATLDAAAQHLYTALFPAVYNDLGQKAAEGVNRAVSELRRVAAEAGPADTVGQDDGEGRPVAYRSPGTRTLYCVTCARQETGWQPLTQVADGAVCDFCGGRCLDIAFRTLGDVIARYVDAEQPETQAEDPARIDRLRPEFTEHASVESIDTQLRRARSQERRWHLRVEWLISLRDARVAQKARGEWPAAAQPPQGA